MAYQSRNPYIFDRPISNAEDFFDREEVLASCWETVRQCRHLSLVGGPGSGKTSLLNQMLNLSPGHVQLVRESAGPLVYLDCRFVSAPERFFEQVSAPIIGQVQPSPDTYNAPITDEREFVSFLQDLPRRPALLMDNFCSLAQNPSFPLDFFSLMRGIATNLEIPIITTSCQRLTDCVPSHKAASPFWNIFTVMDLVPFTEDALITLLTVQSQRSGLSLLPYRNEIQALGGGIPFFMQLACWHYFEALSNRSGPLSVEDHHIVQRRVAEDAASHFGRIWEILSPEEQRAARQIAQGGGTKAQDRAVISLQNKGYVVENHLFSLPFAEFVLACGEEKSVGECA